MKGKFIVFEGIDGCGKSTQATLLYEFLKEKGIPALRLFEPTNGMYGREIRKMLKGEISLTVEEQIELFIFDRRQDYKENIAPALEKGDVIVMDRYFYSNAAYQGSEHISPSEIVLRNLKEGFPEPDRVYFIDIEPSVAMKRITDRNGGTGTELFEKVEFLERVRENFLSVADGRFLKIDGGSDPDYVFKLVREDFLSLAD